MSDCIHPPCRHTPYRAKIWACRWPTYRHRPVCVCPPLNQIGNQNLAWCNTLIYTHPYFKSSPFLSLKATGWKWDPIIAPFVYSVNRYFSPPTKQLLEKSATKKCDTGLRPRTQATSCPRVPTFKCKAVSWHKARRACGVCVCVNANVLTDVSCYMFQHWVFWGAKLLWSVLTQMWNISCYQYFHTALMSREAKANNEYTSRYSILDNLDIIAEKELLTC